MEALRELELSHVALERYVQLSFHSQERLTDSFKVLSWLAESREQPEKLKADDYWLRGKEKLETIDGLTGCLREYELADRAEFATSGAVFDTALEASVTLVAGILSHSLGEDPAPTATRIDQEIRRMNDTSSRLVRISEQEANRVITTMKKGLDRIFDRIETERQTIEMLAEQTGRVEPREIGGIKAPGNGASEAAETQAANTAAEADTKVSPVQEGQARSSSGSWPAINPF